MLGCMPCCSPRGLWLAPVLRSGRTGVIASEEEDQPVAVEETYSGDYVVVFDPLDGSSNIDAGEAAAAPGGAGEEGWF